MTFKHTGDIIVKGRERSPEMVFIVFFRRKDDLCKNLSTILKMFVSAQAAQAGDTKERVIINY